MCVRSILDSGTNGAIVDVECHTSNGLPMIVIVGLGNKAVEESKERVRSAFAACKLELPRKRITINLAPADIPKDSTSLDLAIAAAILVASGQTKSKPKANSIIIGELGLDGSVRAVRGIIGKLTTAMRQGFTHFYIPSPNLTQALLVPRANLLPVDSLGGFRTMLDEPATQKPKMGGSTTSQYGRPNGQHSFSEIVGQRQAKRAMQIAAAGGHNILLYGPPGTGKSMLAKALPSILPPLNQEEMLDVTHLHSLTNSNYDHLVTERPFRAPHHTASHIAMIGGGLRLRPGEVSLSHRGVLFLDELPEFQRQTIEALRQPLEDRQITIARAKESICYPADFLLVATANPCPCGFFGTDRPCTCLAHAVLQYQQKISRPILDRIDLYVSMEQVEHAQLLETRGADDGAIRTAIVQVRQLQAKRYGNNIKLNAHMDNRDLRKLAKLAPDAKKVIDQAGTTLQLSARAYMRALKVARTIADLAGSETIEVAHVTEALQYRNTPPTATST